jgi:hypothetical protein
VSGGWELTVIRAMRSGHCDGIASGGVGSRRRRGRGPVLARERGARASTADSMAVSSAVPGRGRDDKLPDVTVIDPCDMPGAACRTKDVSPHRHSSTMRRRLARSFFTIAPLRRVPGEMSTWSTRLRPAKTLSIAPSSVISMASGGERVTAGGAAATDVPEPVCPTIETSARRWSEARSTIYRDTLRSCARGRVAGSRSSGVCYPPRMARRTA